MEFLADRTAQEDMDQQHGMERVLIIDDEPQMCSLLVHLCTEHGYIAEAVQTLRDGLRRAQQGAFDLVLLDVHMPDGVGLDHLPKIRAVPSHPEVIIITGMTSPDGAELAIKSGAWDYVEKGSPLEAFALPMLRAMEYRREKRAHRPAVVALNRDGIIGSSLRIRACLDQMAQAARSEVSVLLSCETGTGKELFARAIHENSHRANGPFVVVDCAALPEHLAESALFGHGQGAFTGAHRARTGLVAAADRGTLLLDEIGELPVSMQRTFLRVLQERRFRPVGTTQEIASDFRLIAATNRNLTQAVVDGAFREDLLFRLQALVIELPPLRARASDIPDIAGYHIRRICERYGISMKGHSPEFMDTLKAYAWPGNVRELVQAIEHAVAAAMDVSTLYPHHLPTAIRIQLARAAFQRDEPEPLASPPSNGKLPEDLPPIQDFRAASVDVCERQYLEHLLARHGSRIEDACDVSGLSRSRLYGLMQKHGISRRS
jgi:two-component system NtrC family response regulator